MTTPLSPSAQRVQDRLAALGFGNTVIEHEQTTRTSAEAAQAIGCEVGQIAKSLVFKGKQSGRAVLVIASGANRVDEKKLRDLLGERVEKPDADFVRAKTGFVIGGVPPFGNVEPLTTFLDESLMRFSTIWAAAGTPNAVFELTPAELVAMTGGNIAAVAL